MKIIDLFSMGIRNLTRRKARTSLTIIGVVIGTFSIIIMMSLGIGMSETYTKQIMQMGSLTQIEVMVPYNWDESTGKPVETTLKLNDEAVTSIKALAGVKAASPVWSRQLKLVSGKGICWLYVQALDFSVIADFDMPDLKFGEWPSGENLEGVILGQWDGYFNNTKNYEQVIVDLENDPIKYTFDPSYGEENWGGQDLDKISIDFKPQPIVIAGQFAESSKENSYSSYMDIEVLKGMYREYIKKLPLADRKIAETEMQTYSSIKVSVKKLKDVAKVEDKLNDMGYQTYSLNDMVKEMEKTSNTLQLILGGIGAVSLLVSAIGIANTMIMSIYERTKEIGVMKVLGCLVTDIRKLFLFESTLIGLFGGIFGIIMSYIASFLVNKYGADLLGGVIGGGGGYYGEQVTSKVSIIPFWLVLVALVFSLAVGMLSGYYPARRATKIRALEALKTE
jgi:ABC-type antimicrobial peptide transport system permease subunit